MASSRIVLTGDERLAFGRAEGAEVVLADERLRGEPHRVAVERAKGPAGQAGLERRPHRRLEQQVDVAAADRAGARMKARRHEAAPLHGDVGRQVAVGAAHPGIDGANGDSVSKWTTWFSACTPASVRPAQIDLSGVSANALIAASTWSCTVRPPGWLCQPL